MITGFDEITILRGSKFYGTWQWTNSSTGLTEDFSGLTATVKIKNIHEDFEDVKNTYEVGTATVEPLDSENNIIKGRIDIELSTEDTLKFAIPENEEDRYGESDFYSVLTITLSNGEVCLQAKVRVVESLESETLNFLLDEKDEAIAINNKLDNVIDTYTDLINRYPSADALDLNQSLGYNQSYHSYNSAEREIGTTYTNDTGRPILVKFNSLSAGADNFAIFIVDGVSIETKRGEYISTLGYQDFDFTFIIPPNSTYRIDGTIGSYNWFELR